MIKYHCDKCGAELTEDDRFIITNNFKDNILEIRIVPITSLKDELFCRCCMMKEVRFLVDNRYFQGFYK